MTEEAYDQAPADVRAAVDAIAEKRLRRTVEFIRDRRITEEFPVEDPRCFWNALTPDLTPEEMDAVCVVLVKTTAERVGFESPDPSDYPGWCDSCVRWQKTVHDVMLHERLGHRVHRFGLFGKLFVWSKFVAGSWWREHWWDGVFAGQSPEYVARVKARLAELAKASHIEAPFDHQEAGT